MVAILFKESERKANVYVSFRMYFQTLITRTRFWKILKENGTSAAFANLKNMALKRRPNSISSSEWINNNVLVHYVVDLTLTSACLCHWQTNFTVSRCISQSQQTASPQCFHRWWRIQTCFLTLLLRWFGFMVISSAEFRRRTVA